MWQLTVGDLLDENIESICNNPCTLYVVTDNLSDLTFYVGKSTRQVLVRLYEHLGRGQNWVGGFPGYPDHLGRFILRRLPWARDWLIWLLTLEDVMPIPEKKLPYDWRVDNAERLLIGKLRPCLNTVNAHYDIDVPMHYLDPAQYEVRGA